MLIDLIYPQVCGICGRINKKALCKKCENQVKEYEINKIDKVEGKYFEYQIKVLKYDGIIRERMIEYKFKEKAYLYKSFTKIILNNEKVYRFLKKYDIMLCVPMYWGKKWQRGYNQTELVAKEIAQIVDISFKPYCLKKIKNTEMQSTLTKTKRIENVKNAFKVQKEEMIKNKKIVLFDDIYTTGSTVNECSRVLKKSGAKEIAVLTIAVD